MKDDSMMERVVEAYRNWTRSMMGKGKEDKVSEGAECWALQFEEVVPSCGYAHIHRYVTREVPYSKAISKVIESIEQVIGQTLCIISHRIPTLKMSSPAPGSGTGTYSCS